MCQSTPFRAPSSTPAEAQKQTVTNTVGGIERTLECKTSSIQDEFFVTHKTAVESCVRQYTGRATLPSKNPRFEMNFFWTRKTAVESCVRQYTGRATLPLKKMSDQFP